jgi:hypothetical protein
MNKSFIALFIFPLISSAYEDGDFSIERSDTSHPMKCMYDVRLKKEIEIGTIKSIAMDVRQNCEATRNVFIKFYLKDQSIGENWWAYANFAPDLKAEITGFSADAIKKASPPSTSEKSKNQNGKVIGKWVDNTTGGAIYVMVLKDNVYRMTVTYGDGSNIYEYLNVKGSGASKKYIIRNNNFGEYYRIIGEQLKVFEKDGAESIVADEVKR